MTKIVFSPKLPPDVMDIGRPLLPPGFEMVEADPGTPEFYQALQDAEFFLG